MRQQAIYDRLCDAVRKCVSPIRKVAFSPAEWGVNENVVTAAHATFWDN